MKKFTILFICTICTFFSFSQETHYVNAGMYYYTPSDLTINQGDIVIWINDGGTHDVNGETNSITGEPFNNPEVFNSDAISEVGATIYTHTFNVPGLYNYDCSVYGHASAGMIGSINVEQGCVDDDNAAVALANMWNPDISGCEDAIPYLNMAGYPCETDLSVLGMSGTIADICECTCAEEPVESTTVVDIIVGSEDHNTLETAVITAGLVDALSGEGPFTVFAPTDAAFDALPEGTLDAVLADMDLLTSILTHHVASGSVLSTELSDGMMITTLNETELMVSINDNGVMIDNAMVTMADIMADNGVVHVINAVLIPEDGCENEDSIIESAFNTLSTCDEAVAYLVDNYGYTTEEACAWNGDMGNGPLFGGMMVSEFCECTCAGEPVESTTVVDIIVGSEDHNTLETAVITAGLVDALSGEGPFTVFAPTDAAFDALPEGTLDAVLADMDLLTSILTHHVASGSVLSTELSDGMMITTLNETELMVSINDNGVMIDNAMVTVADIMADNGVVHVINVVLVPEDGCENDNDIIAENFGNFFINDCDALIEYLIANYGYSEYEACIWDGNPMADLGMEINEICECSCENVENTSSINELNNSKKIVKIIDLLGKETNKKGFIIEIYNDGSVQKKYINN